MRYLVLGILFWITTTMPLLATTFAQLALGGGYEATLIITNKSVFTWSGRIYVYQGMEQRWAGQWSINNQSFTGMDYAALDLKPKETRKMVFRGDSTTRSGYLEIYGWGSSSSSDIAIAYFYNFYRGGVLASTTGSGPSAWDTKLIFAVERDLSKGIDTGYAWCPFIVTSPFQIKLSLYDVDGNVVQSKTVTFAGHLAEFVSQTFANLPAVFIGHMLIESQSLIALEVLRIESSETGFLLTSTPADDYVP